MRAWPSSLTYCFLSLFLSVTNAEVALDPITARLASANPTQGKTLFLQCSICHVVKQDARYTVGPNLWNIVGRPIASRPNYPYSDSLKQLDGNWDYETLNRYLFDPKAMAAKTRMIFKGIKRADERANLIAYLRTLSNKPIALPSLPTATPTYGGLPDGKGREAVYFTCRACHSLDQFTQKRLDRKQWAEIMLSQAQENGMEPPESWARQLMLDYLTTHFGKIQEKDWLGLPPGPGREEVFYTCKACHSLMLVQQQGLSRKDWEETLVWMVEEQGMDAIEDETTHNLILDYLATHYGSEH